MIPTCDIKVILRSDAVQVALIMGAVMRSGNGIPLLRCWTRLPPSAVIAPQFQPAPVFFCPILSGKTSRPLPAPSQRYNTLDFASKVVCQGDAVPVGFPATKPPVSLDSSGQEGLSPSFGIHPKSKNRMCEMITHILLCFSEKQQKSLFLFCHFSLLAPIIIVVFTAIAVKAQ